MKLLPQKQGNEAEKRIAKKLGAKLQPASGAKWYAKEDMKYPAKPPHTHLIQLKTTNRKQYYIMLKNLQTLEKNAVAAYLEPLFILEFNTKNGGRLTYAIQRYYNKLPHHETGNHSS